MNDTRNPVNDYLISQEGIDVFYENLPADCPKLTDFENFLIWANKQYCGEYDIIFTRSFQENYVPASRTPTKKRGLKTKPIKTLSITTVPDPSEDRDSPISNYESEKPGSNQSAPKNIVKIEAVYNSIENLVKLKFLKNRTIPRMVMKLIAFTIPFQKDLTSITIYRGLPMDTLSELSNFLPNSQITELCFDGTFLDKANYHILLSQNKLKHLSLARCSLNDAVVKNIADLLVDPSPATKILSALNLSCNKITDVGAKYLADMLRKNRQLCYLNLAGNMITDEGGVRILGTLQKFQALPEEITENRAKYVAFLKKKNALINKFVEELQAAATERNLTKKKAKKNKLSANQSVNCSESIFVPEIVQDKAEFMANRQLGEYNEPFSPNNIEVKDGVVYCLGNNTLCCLNLAYNNLTYISLKKLLEVLTMQKNLNRIPRGLIKVVIEGNLMPIACEEFGKIDNLLEPPDSDIKKPHKK